MVANGTLELAYARLELNMRISLLVRHVAAQSRRLLRHRRSVMRRTLWTNTLNQNFLSAPGCRFEGLPEQEEVC